MQWVEVKIMYFAWMGLHWCSAAMQFHLLKKCRMLKSQVYLMDDIFLGTSPHNLCQKVVQCLSLSILVWFIQQGLPPLVVAVWINAKKQQQAINICHNKQKQEMHADRQFVHSNNLRYKNSMNHSLWSSCRVTDL